MLVVRSQVALAAVAGLTVAGVAGCAPATPQRAVEAEVARVFKADLETPTKTVDCPGDLKGAEGTRMACRVTTADGQRVTASLRVTGVDGDELVRFEVTDVRPRLSK